MSFLGINNGSPTLVFANIVTFDKRQCLLYATKYHKSIIIHGMTRIAPKRVTNFLNPRAPRNSFSTFNFNPLPHHRIMNEMDDPGLFRTSSDSTDLRTESMDSAMSHPSVSKACGAGGDIWWSNISYSVGTAQILTNCWGHVRSYKL